jgi:glucose-1-phosphate thymidylyltransferase
MMDLPYGVPYTINQAFPFIKDSMVIFGFPDIIFQPQNAFIKLLQKQNESKSDIVLGLFSTHANHKGDMVTLGQDGRLERIQTDPESIDRGYTWIIAAWTPQFTHFLNNYITSRQRSGNENKTDASNFNELFMGDIFQIALENDISTEVVHFPEGNFLDIGNPENLIKIIRTDLRT